MGEFDDWYRESYRRVVAAMHLLTGDRVAAIDAADEAFARAYERWSRVSRMDSPLGWTWVVARNALRSGHRTNRRRADAQRRAASDQRGTPPDIAIEVWDAVRRLPRREREVVALRYLGGMQEHEIADALGIAPGTVARALHDARGTLARTLRDAPVEDRHD